MKIIGFNSGRKDNNTSTLIKEALKGAESKGAETKLIHLNEVNFHGCYGCLSCKKLNSPTFGRCSYSDGLKPILDEVIEEADGIIMGTPIYFSHPASSMEAFMERLIFPLFAYTNDGKTLLQRKIPAGMIYTMNCTEEQSKQHGYDKIYNFNGGILQNFLGSYDEVIAYDTYQFPDYSKYASEMFDEQHKIQIRDTQFPVDKQNAFNLGIKIIEKINH